MESSDFQLLLKNEEVWHHQLHVLRARTLLLDGTRSHCWRWGLPSSSLYTRPDAFALRCAWLLHSSWKCASPEPKHLRLCPVSEFVMESIVFCRSSFISRNSYQHRTGQKRVVKDVRQSEFQFCMQTSPTGSEALGAVMQPCVSALAMRKGSVLITNTCSTPGCLPPAGECSPRQSAWLKSVKLVGNQILVNRGNSTTILFNLFWNDKD